MNLTNFPWISFLIVAGFYAFFLVYVGFLTAITSWKQRESDDIEIYKAMNQGVDWKYLENEKKKFFKFLFPNQIKVFLFLFPPFLVIFFLLILQTISDVNSDNFFRQIIISPIYTAIFMSATMIAVSFYGFLIHIYFKIRRKKFLVDMDKLYNLGSRIE